MIRASKTLETRRAPTLPGVTEEAEPVPVVAAEVVPVVVAELIAVVDVEPVVVVVVEELEVVVVDEVPVVVVEVVVDVPDVVVEVDWPVVAWLVVADAEVVVVVVLVEVAATATIVTLPRSLLTPWSTNRSDVPYDVMTVNALPTVIGCCPEFRSRVKMPVTTPLLTATDSTVKVTVPALKLFGS